ncbi:hypothetical protein [Mameliella alba]|uniref:Uncharacterized protein n=1 Tax=Mameliella alba TaxID=561184 RepID=A0A0B3RT81_9RHOB|nr:hypothetical protein [Mameliella alba]KHQ51232.1 hypothetical protein OA50_04265 [Mameliella alba]
MSAETKVIEDLAKRLAEAEEKIHKLEMETYVLRQAIYQGVNLSVAGLSLATSASAGEKDELNDAKNTMQSVLSWIRGYVTSNREIGSPIEDDSDAE